MTSKILTNKLGLKPAGDSEKLKKDNSVTKKRQEETCRSGERSKALENRNDAQHAKNKGQVAARHVEFRRSPAEGRRHAPDVPPQVQSKAGMQNAVQTPFAGETLNSVQVLEAQLKDALEKNQQWLAYDQQREAYVQGLMARLFDLEKQAASSKETKESSSDEQEKQMHYDRLLLEAKRDLEEERQVNAQLRSELSPLRITFEEEKKKASELSAALKSRAETEHQQREDDRRRVKEKVRKLKSELDVFREMYDCEKRRNSELSSQIEKMQSSLRSQQEDQQKVATLELQIQRCTSDLENEKMDRRNVQQQLDKVLKELRKTREQITKLEPGKRDIYFVDTSGNFASEFDNKLTVREQPTSPKTKNFLDESFLECPRCRVVYPTSQHRELLAHIDFCTS